MPKNPRNLSHFWGGGFSNTTPSSFFLNPSPPPCLSSICSLPFPPRFTAKHIPLGRISSPADSSHRTRPSPSVFPPFSIPILLHPTLTHHSPPVLSPFSVPPPLPPTLVHRSPLIFSPFFIPPPLPPALQGPDLLSRRPGRTAWELEDAVHLPPAHIQSPCVRSRWTLEVRLWREIGIFRAGCKLMRTVVRGVLVRRRVLARAVLEGRGRVAALLSGERCGKMSWTEGQGVRG